MNARDAAYLSALVFAIVAAVGGFRGWDDALGWFGVALACLASGAVVKS